MEIKEKPALAAPFRDLDWESLAPWLLDRATAQGRRDGLAGWRSAAPDSPPPGLPQPWPAPPALLLAGLGQCYAAGLRHGQEVRLEQARRRAASWACAG
ncbi:hypothetical protein [Roseomonas sp. 18066]|uniref:hypothetical protein n=1 Tax=Roseomonas sp. 18066 TaxID=2681412 RepID=UPI001357BBEB|nr:hypothetical protein [Roseomonas sp. 18066]